MSRQRAGICRDAMCFVADQETCALRKIVAVISTSSSRIRRHYLRDGGRTLQKPPDMLPIEVDPYRQMKVRTAAGTHDFRREWVGATGSEKHFIYVGGQRRAKDTAKVAGIAYGVEYQYEGT